MIRESVRVGERTLELETGRIANQAHGAVLLREGDTVILATAVYNPAGAPARDFLPLTVDHREYMSAVARIPGGFLRREGRSSEREVLASRLCDRSLRPLFPKAYRLETQVITTVLSYDVRSDAPVLAMIAAAAALHLSEIPWRGPLAAIRVGRCDGSLVALPALEQLSRSTLDLVASFSREGVVMLEGGAQQMPDGEVLESLAFAQDAVQPLLASLDKLREAAGREKVPLPEPEDTPAFDPAWREQARGRLAAALAIPEKQARRAAMREVRQAVIAELPERGAGRGNGQEANGEAAEGMLADLEAELLREQVLAEGKRVDGRGPEEIRPIAIEVDWLPATHGSALFTRGETQAMVSLTLGTQQDRQRVESIEGVTFDRFLLHYGFPPYSVGEVRPLRGPGRREVGHGALARRALAAVVPGEEAFPYTVRLVSEISESNGSSSMATVCGGCLALMDGGVPIAAPVAGIAMGLIREGERHVILSDILGDEDHLGDMDFKVAGTAEGVTAIQMDNKVGSLPPEVMAKAFEQARQGRLHILAEMGKVLEGPRPELKPNAPVIASLSIASQRVRDLIGPGGRTIQEIQREHGVRVEVADSGSVRIYAPTRDALHAGREAVLEVAGSLEVGRIYEGVVTGVKEFGAFVRVRGQDGLVHISEWTAGRVDRMSEVAKPGDLVQVRVLEPDRAGRLSLSRKEAL